MREEKHNTPRGGSGQESPGELSRRGFLKGVALSAGAAAVSENGVLGASPPAAQSGAPVGPGPVEIVLNVNGQEKRLRVEPRVTLLNALRDHIEQKANAPVDLTGSKRVCDRGSCGACTVIIDDKTVYSCSMLAIEAQGKKITTVEGLATGDEPHPVQEAFVECDGLMCGFCTPGFVVSSKNLLDRNAHPSLEAIKRALNGNICRCGTYGGVFKAVQLASVRMKGG